MSLTRFQDLEGKLLRKRRIEGDCWIWTGSNNGRYGEIRFGRKLYKIHKVAAAVYLGYVLDEHDSKYQVNHKCPNKLCFNPEHLYIGTQGENLKDAYREGTKHPPTFIKSGVVPRKENLSQ